METLVDKIRRGDRRCLARAMSIIDSGAAEAQALQDAARRDTGAVPWWGFTGPPGVGKSTLIDALLTNLRERGNRVGVVAVDPTSPLSDGALLGDRVRMMRHAEDAGVFIRSLATHGCSGGLSDATLQCARLLELAGFDPVLIETVGVGQSEAEVAAVADVCVVMLGPGYGDDIQLIKAGLLEVADLLVVNKCDLPEAGRLMKEVHVELAGDRQVETVGVEAKSGKGVDELLTKLLELDCAARDPARRTILRRRRTLGEIRRFALQAYGQALHARLQDGTTQTLIDELETGKLTLDEVVTLLSKAAAAEA